MNDVHRPFQFSIERNDVNDVHRPLHFAIEMDDYGRRLFQLAIEMNDVRHAFQFAIETKDGRPIIWLTCL